MRAVFNNIEELESYIRNPKNFKTTHKKQYIIWCAKPKSGVSVYNKLEDFSNETSEQHPFIMSGVYDARWVVDFECLASTYTFEDGSEITEEALSRIEKNGVIDWFKVKTKPNSKQKWACFIPVENSFKINTDSGDMWCNGKNSAVGHNKGDFIICNDNNNKPDMESRWVINGAVFAGTYDTTNFSDCIGEGSDVSDIHKPDFDISI